MRLSRGAFLREREFTLFLGAAAIYSTSCETGLFRLTHNYFRIITGPRYFCLAPRPSHTYIVKRDPISVAMGFGYLSGGTRDSRFSMTGAQDFGPASTIHTLGTHALLLCSSQCCESRLFSDHDLIVISGGRDLKKLTLRSRLNIVIS